QVGPADGGQGLQPSPSPDRGHAARWKPTLARPLLPQPVGLARVRAAAAVVVGGGGAVAAGRAVTPVDHGAAFSFACSTRTITPPPAPAAASAQPPRRPAGRARGSAR